MPIDENDLPALRRWSDALSVALFAVSGPRSILPKDEELAARSWWAPIAWLRANALEPKRLQSWTVYRRYPSPEEPESKSYLFRFADWDGAEDRRRLKCDGICDLTLQVTYSVTGTAEWARIETLLDSLEREVVNDIASPMPPYVAIESGAARTIENPKVVQNPVYYEFHRASPYAAITLSCSPTSRRRSLDKHWESVWSVIGECESIKVMPAELVERYEIPPFGEYLDVAADGLNRIAQLFT